MISVYGSTMCPDCQACTDALDENHIPYTFIDIQERIENLKAFIRLRDHHPAFDPCKAHGYIGIPALMMDDGTVTLDWESVLPREG